MTMMNAATDEPVGDALKRLLAGAATDPDLRRRLLADPKAALAESGLSVADGVTVSVEETPLADAAAVLSRWTAASIVLPVPTRPDADPNAGSDGALTDDDLDGVSGGGPFTSIMNALTLLPTIPIVSFFKYGPASVPGVTKDLADSVAKQWHDKSTA